MIASGVDEISVLTDRRRLAGVHSVVLREADRVEAAYADLAETLLAGARTLREEADEADFSPPPYPPAKRREIELTLSQTREMKLRLGPREERR